MQQGLQKVDCDNCEKQFSCPVEIVDRQLRKFGGNFCSWDCKTTWVYNEFDYMMRQPVE
jgi:hypothetical protein